jgi:hypothetical protein
MTDESAAVSDELLPQLRRALQHLAAPADEQHDYLRGLGATNADELALELDDIASAAEPMLPDGCRGALRDVDRALAAMSDRSQMDVWSLEALMAAPEWEDVRRRAAAALRLLPA